jgi:hypothetical protein
MTIMMMKMKMNSTTRALRPRSGRRENQLMTIMPAVAAGTVRPHEPRGPAVFAVGATG